MTDSAEQLHHDLRQMKDEVSGRFSRLEKALEQMTKIIRDLVRLDGDIRLVTEANGRIGREVEDHEDRLRVLEGRPGKRYDKLVDRVFMLGVGAAVSWVATGMVH